MDSLSLAERIDQHFPLPNSSMLMLGHIAETGQVVNVEFCNGNVPPAIAAVNDSDWQPLVDKKVRL